MFTGIVQGLAAVSQVQESDNFKSFKIQFPAGKADGVQIGASVAINGTCLTVTAIEQDVLSFDVMSETLRATSLGALKVRFDASVVYCCIALIMACTRDHMGSLTSGSGWVGREGRFGGCTTPALMQ